MRLVIAQLSDWHFREVDENPLQCRGPELAAAIASECVEADACTLLISGDVAFSGKQSEYLAASAFLTTVCDSIMAAHPSLDLRSIAVPGNHDCDFSIDTSVRDAILASCPDHDAITPQIIEQCCTPQKEFFSWTQSATTVSTGTLTARSLIGHLDMSIKGETARFILLNTAWHSSLSEKQGGLRFPARILTDYLSSLPDADVVIATLHHPYNWLASADARTLRNKLDDSTDMIFTGHEHNASVYQKITNDGQKQEYIEGSALQCDDPNLSEFTVVNIDTDNEQQSHRSFHWAGAEYKSDTPNAVVRPFEEASRRLQGDFILSTAYESDFLTDAGSALTHPNSADVTLHDLYVFPDVRVLKSNQIDTADTYIRANKLRSHLLSTDKCLILGDEQAGKSALAKIMFSELRKAGRVPVILSGRKLKSPAKNRIVIAVERALKSTYDGDVAQRFWGLDKSKRTIIVDDLDFAFASSTERGELAEMLPDLFGHVYLLASTEIRTDLLTATGSSIEYLWNYDPIEIMEFGHVRRHTLIRKWLTTGTFYGDSTSPEFQRDLANHEAIITNMLVKDVLPSHPVFVLMILQTMESTKHHGVSSGSFGYLYESMITHVLNRAASSTAKIDTLYSYLADYAAKLYECDTDSISSVDAQLWHTSYCQRMGLGLEFKSVLKVLKAHRILAEAGESISFRYPFLRQYFLARHIARNLTNLSVQALLKELVESLHVTDIANTLMFVCHISRDPMVVDSVLEKAQGLFSAHTPYDMTKQLLLEMAPAESLFTELPATEPEHNREHIREKSDRVAERQAADTSDETDLPDTFAADLNASGKTVQILGQILRSFSGSIEQSRKIEISQACFQLGLRSMAAMLNAIEENADMVLEYCHAWLRREHPEWNDERVERAAKLTVYANVEIMTVGMIRHISAAIGMKDLAMTFDALIKRDETISNKLIHLSIMLDHYGGFPMDRVKTIQESTEKFSMGQRALQGLVWTHFYLYPCREIAVKQSACNLVEIRTPPALPAAPGAKKAK